jgi:hypothetical protein
LIWFAGAKLTDHYDGFFHVAKIHADLSGLYKAQEYRVNEEGKRFKYLQVKTFSTPSSSGADVFSLV